MKNFKDLIRAFDAAQSDLESAIESVDTIIDKMFNGYTASGTTYEGVLDKVDTMIENLTSIAGHITGGGSSATWSTLTGKPFSTLGSNLSVTNDVLSASTPNASASVVGGVKVYFDSTNSVLYITNDGSDPTPT